MSSTVQCTESSCFKVKDIVEVKEVLNIIGMDTYVKEGEIVFCGDSETWFDDSAEVVLSLEPITVEGERTNLVGLISDYICESVDLDSLEEEYGLKEGQYMVQSITEYLQDQLLEGEYISIICSGFTSRCSGSCEPFGDITVITKNNVNFTSLYTERDKMLEELGIKE